MLSAIQLDTKQPTFFLQGKSNNHNIYDIMITLESQLGFPGDFITNTSL